MLLFTLATISLLSGMHVASALNDEKDLVLTPQEKYALEEFKDQVSDSLPEDFMKSDYYLIRWIRAAELDLQQAQTLLFDWTGEPGTTSRPYSRRSKYNDLKHDFPIRFEGRDKQNRPLMTMDFSDWDIRRATLQGKSRRLQRYLTQAIERNMWNIFKAQQRNQEGMNVKPVTRSVVLVDVANFSPIQHACIQCLAILGNWAVVTGQHYRSFHDEVIIINAPPAAVIALNSIKPLMTAELRNMITIFSSNRRAWGPYLDRKIDPSERSQRYGGTK